MITEIIFFLGSLVMLTSVIGVVKFPDLFSRFHAAGLAESLGLPLAFLGYFVAYFPSFSVVKILFCILLIWVISPLTCYLLTRSSL